MQKGLLSKILLNIGISVTWLKTDFLNILIYQEKPIATFVATCINLILGTKSKILF